MRKAEGDHSSPEASSAATSLSKSGGVTVTWQKLDLVAKIGKGENAFEKQILSDMSGHALPGELLALMGPSGAGKTSLLNCLAARTTPSAGEVCFNGRKFRHRDARIVGYVHQQEMLLPSLTPREHLLFQSSLRLPSNVGSAERAKRVDTAIKLLGMIKCQHSVIGDVYTGISKNEKRRLCFATEILTDPSVLFADEPTTGLDSAMAEVIVKYMKALASGGEDGRKVTVVATIHQPSSEVFRVFDKLLFVVDGRLGYFGQASKLEAHLSDIGYPLPMHTPPAEFIMELCIDPRKPEEAKSRRKEICDRFAEMWAARSAPVQILDSDQLDAAERSQGPVGTDGAAGRVGPARQFLLLTRRELLMKVRSTHEMKAMIARCVLFGSFFGLAFFRLPKKQSTVFSINSAIFASMMFGFMNQAMGTSMGMPERVPTLIREHRTGAYSVLGMYLSKTLADLPVDTVIVIIWSNLINWMVGLTDDFDRFCQLMVFMWAFSFLASGVGYLGGYVAPDSGTSFLVVLLNIMPQMLFGGLFINLNNIPPGFRWLETISAFRWGYQCIMLVIWKDLPDGTLECEQELAGPPGCRYRTGEDVIEFFGIDPSAEWWPSLLDVLLIALVYRVLALVALYRSAKPRQFDGQAPEDDTKGEFGQQAGGAENAAQERTEVPIQLSLEWSGVTIEILKKDTKGAQQVPILSNCSGSVEPGELLAIMGPSGAGKTVLMQALANVSELPLTGGEIKVNGSPWKEGARSHCAFMHQESLFFAGLKVREHLAFQMGLRLGRKMDATSWKKIDESIAELGLTSCQHTIIGQIGSGISGGERKRLSFATEILMDPALFIADEPTSGLDSSMARNVVTLMSEMAHGKRGGGKRSIVCTIHQPSNEVFTLFDKLLIIVDGRTAYFGRADASLSHFSSLGLECPRDVSPADFMMRSVAVDAGEDEAREAARANLEKLSAAFRPPPPLEKEQMARVPTSKDVVVPILPQIRALLSREFLLRRRSKIMFKAAIARTVGMNTIFGLLYWQVVHNDESVQSIQGAITVTAINTFMTAGFGLTQELPNAMRPAMRETRLGMYSISAWYWAKTIGDLPLDILLPVIGHTIMFWMVGFRDEVSIWIQHTLVIVAVSLMGSSWGYMCSIAGKTPEIAFMVFLLTVFPAISFNGFLIPSDNIPVYFAWIEEVGPFKYVFSELSTIVWDGYGTLVGCDVKVCLFPDGNKVLSYFGIEPDNTGVNIAVLLVYIVVPRLLGGLFAYLRARYK